MVGCVAAGKAKVGLEEGGDGVAGGGKCDERTMKAHTY